MSLAQHIVRPSRSIAQAFRTEFDRSRKQVSKSSNSELSPDSEKSEAWRKEAYAAALGYMPLSKHTIIPGFTKGYAGTKESQSQAERDAVGRANSILPTHPIFNVTFARVKFMMDWSYGVL